MHWYGVALRCAGSSAIGSGSRRRSHSKRLCHTTSQPGSDHAVVYADGANRQLGKRIDISLSGNVDNILADMCAKANLDYRVLGRQVTLFPKGKMPKNLEGAAVAKGRKMVNRSSAPP